MTRIALFIGSRGRGRRRGAEFGSSYGSDSVQLREGDWGSRRGGGERNTCVGKFHEEENVTERGEAVCGRGRSNEKEEGGKEVKKRERE